MGCENCGLSVCRCDLAQPFEESKYSEGVWFKSAISGMLYRNPNAAGDIDCICVDGVWFEPAITK